MVRDRWELTLRCPKCGHWGMARISEDDYPFKRDPGFAVDGLPLGFRVAKSSKYRHETQIACRCGEVFGL